MHATPGEMKSFRVSADKIALLIAEGAHALTWMLRLSYYGQDDEGSIGPLDDREMRHRLCCNVTEAQSRLEGT